MFGMSFGEILIIAIIAILFLGPDKLPEAMVKIAKFFKSFKKSVHEVKESIEQEIHLEELKEEAVSYKQRLEHATIDLKKEMHVDLVEDLNRNAREIEEAIAQPDTPTESKTKKKKKSEKEMKPKKEDQDV